MSDNDWQSSYPNGQEQGDRLAKVKLVLARIFGDGENPLAWGFTVFKVAGIRVRLHVLFIAYMLSELIFTLPGHHPGFVFVWPRLVAMLTLVLAHEFAHCIVCRKLGGQVDQIMLWPLGGLASCRIPDHWRAEFMVALAGPMIHILLFPLLAALLYVFTGTFESLAFNPMTLGAHSAVTFADGTTAWWLILVESFYALNLVLLIFNLFIPMFPLDSSRAVMALLWKRSTQSKAMWHTVNIGLGAATLLGLIGIIFDDGKMLLAIAIFGGIVCSIERRRLQFLQHGDMIPGLSGAGEEWKQVALVDEDDEEIVQQEELDRILTKISSSGIDSLSRKEKRMLKKATESSRKSQ